MTKLITVFTPAYNRAHTLGRTYESLKRQNSKNFVWLIIDDGSADNTRELVASWQQENAGFPIIYRYKENGGMHTAHNVAYRMIRTELNVCIDSDDELAEDAISMIEAKWAEVKDQGYAGLIGLDADFEGKLIGKGFPDNMTETTLHGYYASGGSGDKKIIYRTDIINSVPEYPEFPGERYVALAYKYLLIDQKFKLAVFNRVLCNVDYQADGSSNTMFNSYLKNPNGFAFWRKQCMTYPSSFKRMAVDAVHYDSSCIIAGKPKDIVNSPKRFLTIVLAPVGYLLTQYIKIKGKAEVG